MLDKIALVFPGQGSQRLGMLKDFYDKFKVFRDKFEEASTALHYDLWHVIAEDEAKLNQTRFTQPALLASSLAILEAAKELAPIDAVSMAGHSLGEYSALVAAKALDFKDALTLVAKRGEWMQEAAASADTAMLVVVGLELNEVRSLANDKDPNSHDYLAVANINSPKQIVLSGYRAACDEAAKRAKELGAKIAKILPVSVAAHCALMQPAALKLKEALKDVNFHPFQAEVLRDIDGKAYSSPSDIASSLVEQVVKGVEWVSIIKNLLASKVTSIFECGPGHVLTGLNRQIGGDAAVTFESWETVVQLENCLSKK